MIWGAFMETDDRMMLDDTFDGIRISTVFLGMDHSFSVAKNHRPVLFETMIFGGEYDQNQQRYCTWAAAVAGHATVVAQIRSTQCKSLKSPGTTAT